MSSSKPILPANPLASYIANREEITKSVMKVLESGWYILGKEVSEFENEFAKFVGSSHCIGVANGTDAVEIALRACGIGVGDGVITVSNTAVATVSAIDLCGAVPVLVDIKSDTFTMDVERLEDTIKAQRRGFIKAIVPVHLFGHPADMTEIMRIADRYGLHVVEDCAQAHGAKHQGKKVGTFGSAGAFSFYPTKNLGAFGDGGGIVTSDNELYDRICMLRQYGWKERYISEIAGQNSRLDELQAAILRVKLKHLNVANRRRHEIAAFYNKSLLGTPLILPNENENNIHAYHQYVVRSTNRDSLMAFVQKRGIGTAILYPVPIHKQAGYSGRVIVGAGGLPKTEELCREIMSLPIYPEMDDDQAARVVEAIHDWNHVR